ncbi:MAG: hypothetical protein JWM40_2471 [Frankiales bacterium]|nr:hypothetical protein [Frankiales bacterium]
MILAADEVSAGSLGLLLTLALIAVTVLLIRNMRKRLNRLPETFEPVSPPDDSAEAASDPTAGA